MSGPALKQLQAHRAIHEGGLTGAVSRTEDLVEALQEEDLKAANEVADDLIDYWKTRVISHADAEEEGFYRDVLEEQPELQEAITQLTRDHDLLRIIVNDIEELRKAEGLSPAVLQKLYALLVVNEVHSREEERLLFSE